MILHVDMDAFYASVEERDNPLLVSKLVNAYLRNASLLRPSDRTARVSGSCEQSANDQWLAAHMTRVQAADPALDRVRRNCWSFHVMKGRN